MSDSDSEARISKDFPVAKTSSIVPHEESASGSHQPERVNLELHHTFDSFMHGELVEGMLEDEDHVIRVAIPEEEVPFKAKALFGQIADEHGVPFYDKQRKRWHGFPGHNNKSMSIPSYMEKLADATHAIVLQTCPNAKRKHWCDIYSDRPVPHRHCHRKPDGFMAEEDFRDFIWEDENIDLTVVPTWCDICGTFEFKTSATAACRRAATFQCAGSARMIFNNQLNRRYVVGYTLTGDILTVIAFDRSGWVASTPFNIHERPSLFLRVVVGSLYLDDTRFGLDPTVRLQGEKREIQVGDEWYDIIDVIHVEGTLRGRSTVCYHVRKDGQDYVVKDYWVDKSRTDKEDEVLKAVKGLKHVPEIVKNEPVMFRGKPDTTAWFRRTGNDFDEDLMSYKGVEIREHRRILLKPLARKLSDFRDLVELLTAIRDIVDAIESVFAKGYIHRDISITNVMLEEKADELRGLLIDYDYAIHKNRAPLLAVGRRTGTLPFMAIDILEGKPTTVHSYKHDLESLFYVLIWICTMQNGPNGELRDSGSFKYKKSVLSIWNGGLHSSTLPFKVVAMAKQSTMFNSGKFEVEISNYFADYFTPIKPCIEQLRQLLFPRPTTSYEQKLLRNRLQTKGVKKDKELSRFLRSMLPNRVPRTFFTEMKAILRNAIIELKAEGHHLSRLPLSSRPHAASEPFYVLHPVSLGLEDGDDVSYDLSPDEVRSAPARLASSSSFSKRPRALDAFDPDAPGPSTKKPRSPGGESFKELQAFKVPPGTKRSRPARSRDSFVHVNHPTSVPATMFATPMTFEFIKYNPDGPGPSNPTRRRK